MLTVDALGLRSMAKARMAKSCRQENVGRIRHSLRYRIAKEISLAEQERDSLHVQRLADALGDGTEQGIGFCEGARLSERSTSIMLDGIGLTKKAPVEPLGPEARDAPAEKQDHDDEHYRAMRYATGRKYRQSEEPEARKVKNDRLQHH